jgi:hypothetical protein
MIDDYEPRIATGYEALGLRLEDHIRWYVPESWCEHIGKVAHPPMVLPQEAEAFLGAFKEGTLEAHLKNHEKRQYSQPWYVQAAIKDFFEEGKHEETEGI